MWAQTLSVSRVNQGSKVESQSCYMAAGPPEVQEQSYSQMTCLNKEGDRVLDIEPRHGVRKLRNQKLERSWSPAEQISTGYVFLIRLLSQCNHTNRTNSYRK